MAHQASKKRILRDLDAMPKVQLGPKREKNPTSVVLSASNKPNEFTPVQMLVAQWYARGMKTPKIARKLQYHLASNIADDKKRLRKARTRVRTMIGTQKMRDLIYAEAQLLLDLESPAIMRGIARKAKAGRVDAARLAFELNGRHSPHTDIQPATINIILGNIPRPSVNRPVLSDPDLIDAKIEIEDAELED